MNIRDIESVIEAVLFASGEPVAAERIAAVLAVDVGTVFDSAQHLADSYAASGRGIRLVRLGNKLQLCSAPEFAEYVRLSLEMRRPPQLTQAALEVLAIAAYFQPVTKAYIEHVRGVDSSYTMNLLQERGLVEPCGRLAAPGRPILYRTTPDFLRIFGISSLEELPPLPGGSVESGEEQMRISEVIKTLSESTKETASD